MPLKKGSHPGSQPGSKVFKEVLKIEIAALTSKAMSDMFRKLVVTEAPDDFAVKPPNPSLVITEAPDD